MKAADKMTKARAGLILDQPFFGSLALRMTVEETTDFDTMATDGKRILFNSDFVDKLTLDECKGVVAHEVMHVACSHNTRRGERKPRTWNEAGDLAINGILINSGFTLPAAKLYDPQHPDSSAEEHYHRIYSDQEEDQEGSGNDPGGCGEVLDLPGKDGKKATEAEKTQADQEQKIALAQAAQQAKASGNLPGGLERLTDEILNPKLDPEEVLRRFVDHSAKNDYVWLPPNRRFIHQGMYLPSMRSNELAELIFMVDTSGSISQQDLSMIAGWLTAILESYDTSLRVIYIDTAVANDETFTRADLPLQLDAMGGGGTDFRPGFDLLQEEGAAPAAVIYLTDLCCSSFPDAPDFPVLWIKTDSQYGSDKVPFGEVLELD